MNWTHLKQLILRDVLPLLGWAIALQLLFDGPWIPHQINLYASLCYVLIVFGGQVVATDGKRLLQYLFQCKEHTATGLDTILAVRGLGTSLLILLEIVTTLWDLKAGPVGQHFPLLGRSVLLTVALPLFYYTSGRLLRRQDAAMISSKLSPPGNNEVN